MVGGSPLQGLSPNSSGIEATKIADIRAVRKRKIEGRIPIELWQYPVQSGGTEECSLVGKGVHYLGTRPHTRNGREHPVGIPRQEGSGPKICMCRDAT